VEFVSTSQKGISYYRVFPIDSGIGLSITIDKLRVFINKTLSTQSLINQTLIKRVGVSIVITEFFPELRPKKEKT
jgi:hypothetical protein